MIKILKFLPLLFFVIILSLQTSSACHDCKTHKEKKQEIREMKKEKEKKQENKIKNNKKTLLRFDLRRIIRNL
tara:strand:+ start:1275 stop:1493 length:219 start_codon:yes stop_codon:yes gene_type:complete